MHAIYAVYHNNVNESVIFDKKIFVRCANSHISQKVAFEKCEFGH